MFMPQQPMIAECSGANSKCHVSPAFTGTIKQGHGGDSTYYSGTDYAAQLPIGVTSPAKGMGVAGLTYQAGF